MVDIKEQGDDDDVSVGRNAQPREEILMQPGRLPNYNDQLFKVVEGKNQTVELKDAGTVNRTVVSKANMSKMAKAEEVSYQAGAIVQMGYAEMSTREKIMTKYFLNCCCVNFCCCFRCCCCVGFPTGSKKITVKEFEKLILFRYGRINKKKGALGAGRHTIYKGVDEFEIVNIQDNFFTFKIPKLLTLENLCLTLTCVISYQVFNAISVITNVIDWKHAIEYIAASIIRDKVGTHTLADILQNTQTYQEAIMKELAEITVMWGVKIIRIELKDFKKINEYLMRIDTQRPVILPIIPVTLQPVKFNLT